MITVNQLIEELIKLRDNGYGELPVIYAIDDEGNDYHKIDTTPDTFLVEDLEKWSLEPLFKEDGEEKILPNCVIIN
jgi:hypothetical protein